MKKFSACLYVSAALLAACGGGSHVTPVSTPTPGATATPVATSSPTPTATATPTPAATATPTPVATATPTPVATATPATFTSELSLPIYDVEMLPNSTVTLNELSVTGTVTATVDDPSLLSATWSNGALTLTATANADQTKHANVTITDGTGAGYIMPVAFSAPAGSALIANPVAIWMQPQNASQQITAVNGSFVNSYSDGSGVVDFSTSSPWTISSHGSMGVQSVYYANADYSVQTAVTVTVAPQP